MQNLDVLLPEDIEFDLLDKAGHSLYTSRVTLYLPANCDAETLGDSFFRVVDEDKIIGSMHIPDEAWCSVRLTTGKIDKTYRRDELDRFHGLKTIDMAIDPALNVKIIKR